MIIVRHPKVVTLVYSPLTKSLTVIDDPSNLALVSVINYDHK